MDHIPPLPATLGVAIVCIVPLRGDHDKYMPAQYKSVDSFKHRSDRWWSLPAHCSTATHSASVVVSSNTAPQTKPPGPLLPIIKSSRTKQHIDSQSGKHRIGHSVAIPHSLLFNHNHYVARTIDRRFPQAHTATQRVFRILFLFGSVAIEQQILCANMSIDIGLASDVCALLGWGW